MLCAAAVGMRSWTRAATCPRPCLHRRARSRTAACTASSRASPSTRDFTKINDEESPVAELGDLPADEVTEESYGPLKALCEDAVREVFGARALVVRPGLIVGPYDPTGRFTYWPHRIARGGEVLAPAPPESPTQVIDVRDLGEWIVDLCARRRERHVQRDAPGRQPGGACSPRVARSPSSDAEITWVSPEFLVEHERRRVDGAAALARRSRHGVRGSRGRRAARSKRA